MGNKSNMVTPYVIILVPTSKNIDVFVIHLGKMTQKIIEKIDPSIA